MLKLRCRAAPARRRRAITVKAGYPPDDTLAEADIAAAAGAGTQPRRRPRRRHAARAKRLFLPLRTGRGAVGVVGLDSDKQGPLLTPDAAAPARCALPTRRRWRSSASIWPRDVDRAKLAAETDRLRSALLTSISHDLRTPLASIIGAADEPRKPSASAARRGRASELLSHHPGRGRAAEPLHRQSPRHDEARIRRRRARAEHGRSVGEIVGSALQRAAQGPGAAPVEVDLAAGSADAEPRPRAVRAGAVQSARQCGKYAPAGIDASRLRRAGAARLVSLQVHR